MNFKSTAIALALLAAGAANAATIVLDLEDGFTSGGFPVSTATTKTFSYEIDFGAVASDVGFSWSLVQNSSNVNADANRNATVSFWFDNSLVVQEVGAKSFLKDLPSLTGIIGTHTLEFVGTAFNGYKGSASFNVTSTVSAVPEPTTYALLLAGLGAVGFVARRRAAV